MNNTYLYKKVLVVDDSNLDRYVSTIVIKNNLFAEEVTTFSGVDTALSYLQSLISSPDEFPTYIFLDINMPNMDGFDFVEHYMKLPLDVQKRCTVVMISSTCHKEDLERIKDYPTVEMFFNKPLSENILNCIRGNVDTQFLSYAGM